MARQKRQYDIEEVNEIIEMKLKQLNGIIDKLSYNGVCTFNKEIANNTEYIRKNGELFKYYPYDFWGGAYKGEENYGKVQIDKIKKERKVQYITGVFDQSVQDVILAVNDLHTKPEKLSAVLMNIYKRDKEKISALQKENLLLKEKNKELKEVIQTMEKAMFNIFYNSESAKNSLINMLDLKRSQDDFMSEQLGNVFCTQKELLERLTFGESMKNTDKLIQMNREKKRLRNKERNL